MPANNSNDDKATSNQSVPSPASQSLSVGGKNSTDKYRNRQNKAHNMQSVTNLTTSALAHSQNCQAQLKDNHTTHSKTTHSKSKPSSIIHPNFDPKQTPIDPARSLLDTPPPVTAYHRQKVFSQICEQISQNKGTLEVDRQPYHKMQNVKQDTSSKQNLSTLTTQTTQCLSQWQLIDSPALASYLELLQAGGLMKVPASFYHNPDASQADPLLQPLYPLSALALSVDMADVSAILQQYPMLTRYGMAKTCPCPSSAKFARRLAEYHQQSKGQLEPRELAMMMPEMLNDIFAPDWEVILYPERFDNGIDSLATDILPCRLAVHALSQCDTRKTINRRLSAQQICQYLRSYLLSQCRLSKHDTSQYRHIRIYEGHVIMAGVFLGWQIQISSDNEVYFAVSSRSSLFTRYPNLTEYYINGWS
ncbi:hypothetical protein [Psychrobacter sp. I-STPA6b]|uniref:hypothetical protein n=1 Tax=Psychrobacter sp. I-STPA6b TaxID=2585718 RepID=UPI001D0C9F2C|nr:hypothetical protein [Psychrobacter sp. I-STPA6b]